MTTTQILNYLTEEYGFIAHESDPYIIYGFGDAVCLTYNSDTGILTNEVLADGESIKTEIKLIDLNEVATSFLRVIEPFS